MPEMRDASQSAAKWARRAGNAGPEYEAGVRSPRKDWATETAAAEDRYKSGVTKAANEGRFGAGVRNAGTSKWAAGAIAKGPQRYSEGVQLAEGAYQKGFAPYADVIRNTQLPERKEKGNPANIDRVRKMAEALHQKKISMKGGR